MIKIVRLIVTPNSNREDISQIMVVYDTDTETDMMVKAIYNASKMGVDGLEKMFKKMIAEIRRSEEINPVRAEIN